MLDMDNDKLWAVGCVDAVMWVDHVDPGSTAGPTEEEHLEKKH
jgi:hypothetical protein